MCTWFAKLFCVWDVHIITAQTKHQTGRGTDVFLAIGFVNLLSHKSIREQTFNVGSREYTKKLLKQGLMYYTC